MAPAWASIHPAADEGHAAIARRAVDGDAGFHQLIASGVDVVDLEGQVAEVAAFAIDLGVPVEGQLQEWRLLTGGARFVFRRRQEDVGVAARLAVDATDLLHAELVAVEIEALLDVGYSHHGMQIA
jgi:hypothetical protein